MNTYELVQALEDVIETRREEREARQRYEGCEWGYHGYSLMHASQKAMERFEQELGRVIAARVNEELRRGMP